MNQKLYHRGLNESGYGEAVMPDEFRLCLAFNNGIDCLDCKEYLRSLPVHALLHPSLASVTPIGWFDDYVEGWEVKFCGEWESCSRRTHKAWIGNRRIVLLPVAENKINDYAK